MKSESSVVREETLANSADLVDGLLRVSQILRFRFNDWLGRFELNDGRHAVLAVLARADQMGCSQAELAEQLGQSESNVSTLIERMQRDGLVSRSRSEADRRKRVLQITSAGRSTIASVDANRTAWAGRLLKGIPADDRSTLLALLLRLGSSLEPSFDACIVEDSSSEPFREPSENSTVPADESESPQLALRRLLMALSSSPVVESREKDAA